VRGRERDADRERTNLGEEDAPSPRERKIFPGRWMYFGFLSHSISFPVSHSINERHLTRQRKRGQKKHDARVLLEGR
jgi:hypothetical protein